jgi:hypothetical protein
MNKVWKPVRADGKRECPECGNAYRDAAKHGHAVVAHFDYSVRPHRWCPGGMPPVDKGRRTAAKPPAPRTPNFTSAPPKTR